MHITLPFLTPNRIEAFAVLARFWLGWIAALIARIGAPGRSRRLHLFVQSLEDGVESILFLRAGERVPPRARRHHAPAAPQGFRYCAAHRRLLLRSARIRLARASFSARVARLIDAMARPEKFIAAFAKRLSRGLIGTRLVAFAPPALALAPQEPPLRAAFSDSS
jgi:hypothetical protein